MGLAMIMHKFGRGVRSNGRSWVMCLSVRTDFDNTQEQSIARFGDPTYSRGGHCLAWRRMSPQK